MSMLLLSLTILNLALLLAMGWILYQVSGWTQQHSHVLLAIQRNLNAWDRPESLSVGAVAPGSSWLATEAEVAAIQQRMESESQQRAGSVPSKRNSKNRTASPMAVSP